MQPGKLSMLIKAASSSHILSNVVAIVVMLSPLSPVILLMPKLLLEGYNEKMNSVFNKFL
jgi:hypothetical protein